MFHRPLHPIRRDRRRAAKPKRQRRHCRLSCESLEDRRLLAITGPEVAKLLASDAEASDYFGYSVSVDGDTAVVGAHNDNGTGSAYVFTRSGTTWTEQARLVASDTAAGDWFGISDSVSGDTAAIGAVANDVGGKSSGSAYVFTRSGTTWSSEARRVGTEGRSGWGPGH